MHFLDDDIELVEGLPQIFREQFAEIQLLDKQVEGITANVREAKRRLFAEYASLSKSEIDERSRAIKEDYKKMRNLHTKKCQLSSGLEQLMDRVNNKVKKDTDDFRYELELENPGCTYEFEKKFTEELIRGTVELHGTFTRGQAALKQAVAQRRSIPDKSLRKLLIDTSGANNLLNVNNRRQFIENESAASSFRPSPVSVDYSPSTSRFSTPRHTPGPVSPAIRQASRQQLTYSNGANIPQSAPANFTAPNFPVEVLNFDPTSTTMPSFASGQESRHGRPRKLTSRVKQMLNEQQKTHRPHHPAIFGAQGISPLSSQGFSLNANDRMIPPRHPLFNSRRQSTSGLSRQQRQKLKRSSVAIDEDDNVSRNEEIMDEEYGSEYDDYMEDINDEDADNQLWCLCQTKSYGNMIACDNQSCTFTWFHYECVGLTESPADGQKWFCPACRNRGIPSTSSFQPAHSSRY